MSPAIAAADPHPPPLTVEDLGRSYGQLVALESLSLRIDPGECVALIGANGSGKSTAVGVIGGLLEPSHGSVRIDGADPHREPDAQRARAATALVPDSPSLYDDLTVHQHLELVALAHGAAGDGLDGRADALLGRLGLASRAHHLPRELSRGMRQKTQLACALIRPARLLVLDEPIVGLDPPSQLLLGDLLLEARAAGLGVLITTHQLGFADRVADRGVLLQEGAVVFAGPWSEVHEQTVARGWR